MQVALVSVDHLKLNQTALFYPTNHDYSRIIVNSFWGNIGRFEDFLKNQHHQCFGPLRYMVKYGLDAYGALSYEQ